MKNTIFFLIFLFGFYVQAEVKAGEENKTGEIQKPSDDKEMNGNKFEEHIFTANLGVNISSIEGVESPGNGLMLSGKYSFYFKKAGVFVGLDYIQRNASEASNKASIDFELTSIDIPFGLAFKHKSFFESLGAFVGIKTGFGNYITKIQGFSVNQDDDVSSTTDVTFGLAARF